MNKLLTWLVANTQLRYQSPARLFRIRYQRAKRVLRAQLLPPAITRGCNMDLKTLANPFQFADLNIRTATDEHSEV